MGLIGTGPDASLLATFDRAGGAGKLRYAEMTVCWAKDEATAKRIAREHWPTSAMESSLSWELPLPEHFEAVAELVTEEQVAESVTCGPDPERHLAAIRKYAAAGIDHICVHQVGKDQKGSLRVLRRGDPAEAPVVDGAAAEEALTEEPQELASPRGIGLRRSDSCAARL